MIILKKSFLPQKNIPCIQIEIIAKVHLPYPGPAGSEKRDESGQNSINTQYMFI